MQCQIGVPGSTYHGFFVHRDADGTYFVRVGSEKVHVSNNLVAKLGPADERGLWFLEHADVDRSDGLELVEEVTTSDSCLCLMGDITDGTWTTDEVLLASPIVREHNGEKMQEQWMLGIVHKDSGVALKATVTVMEFESVPSGLLGFFKAITGQIPLVPRSYESGRTYYYSGTSLTELGGRWDNGGKPIPDPTF